MFEILTAILTIISIVGVILNIKKLRICFVLWIFSNFSWMIVDFYRGIYAQSVLFFVYFLLAIYGLIEWKKDDEVVCNSRSK